MFVKNNGGNILFRDASGKPAVLNTGESADVPDGVYWKHQDKLVQLPAAVIGHTIDHVEQVEFEDDGDKREPGSRSGNTEDIPLSDAPFIVPHGYRRLSKAALTEWIVGNLKVEAADLELKTKADLIAMIESAVPGAANQ